MDSVAAENFSNFQLDVASLPKFEEVKLQPISKKYLVKSQVGTTISLLFFGIGLIVAYSFVPAEFQNYIIGGGIFLALIFGWSFFNNIMYVRRSGYAMREQDIIFHRGFLFERTTVVPFNRIQHVSVERSFLDKILNISTLKVFTAGGSGSDINIPGIYPQTATSVKEEISTRIYNHA
ncbi:PH domain-containing protein [Salinimicrobium xinjiangense]|uniref:PH domain-containing protein n=1 Tax=Salinimicrobium xinjiangense TaxID=438596 RepID=UPI00040AF8A9|nr:PH domain-containing protein [Salinimicrobium xinjiangense]